MKSTQEIFEKLSYFHTNFIFKQQYCAIESGFQFSKIFINQVLNFLNFLLN